jgi:hypothetical protein
MLCFFRPLSVPLLLAALSVSFCSAQEVASINLTVVPQRLDLRRPQPASHVTGGSGGIGQTVSCLDSRATEGTLKTSLLSLDRADYRLEDQPVFEVTVENTGSKLMRIPFSPHLADLQPEDPARKFAYSELRVTLWISSDDDQWSADTGGRITLYGAEDHADTMLSLEPGQWVRVIGSGKFTLPSNGLNDDLIRSKPVGRVFAQASLYRSQTLITPTQSASVSREVCISQEHEPGVPIRLPIP